MTNKQRNQARGFQKTSTHLECFIFPSEGSDAHCVYLAIGNQKHWNHWNLNSFNTIVDAWDYLLKARDLLKGFKYFSHQGNDEIAYRFSSAVRKAYPDVNSTDQCLIIGDALLIHNWQKEGNRPGIDVPPPGIEVKDFSSAVKKKYSIRWQPGSKAFNHCGNPESSGVFVIVKNSLKALLVSEPGFEPFLTGDAETRIYPSYVTAAYTADYINTQNKDWLSREETLRLLNEAKTLFPEREWMSLVFQEA